MPPVIDPEKCTRCATCAEVCSEDVFFGTKRGETPVVTYPEECWHCNACVLDCPSEGAIRLRIPLPMIMAFLDPAEQPGSVGTLPARSRVATRGPRVHKKP